MAQSNVNIVVSAKDNASKVFTSVGKSASGLNNSLISVSNAAKIAALAAATAAIAIGTKLAKAAFDSAVELEQTSIAFETLIGNADLAKKTMKDLADFSLKTPFELTQLQEASKRLLAYGVTAEELIPTIEDLGNISAGVGRDKLGQLILAFGQVKAATYLTGAELRQFTEAGVPLLDELAKQSGKTAGQVKEDMEEGIKIPFQDVQKAIDNMTGEGGKFFNLMEKQSASAGGIISNLKEQFNFLKLAILGVDPDGTIQPGGLFDKFKNILDDLYVILNDNKEAIIGFGKAVGTYLSEKLESAIDSVKNLWKNITYLKDNFDSIMREFDAKTGVVTVFTDEIGKLWFNIKYNLIPTIEKNKQFFIDLGKAIGVIAVVVGVMLIKTLNAIVSVSALVIDTLGKMNEMFKNFKETLSEASEWGLHFVENFTKGMLAAIPGVGTAVSLVTNALEFIKFSKNKNIPSEVWGQHMIENFAEGMGVGAGDIDDQLENIKERMANRIENFSDSFVTLKDKVKEALSDYTSAIKSARKTYKETMSDIAADREALSGGVQKDVAKEILGSEQRLAEAQKDLFAETAKAQEEQNLDRISELQATINEENVFLKKHAQDYKDYAAAIKEERRLESLDSIELAKEQYALELADLNQREADALEIKQKAFNSAYQALRENYKLIKADTKDLVSELVKEFNGIPTALIDALKSVNKKLGKVKLEFGAGSDVQKFSDGGVVPGVGNQDTVPALLTPGEIVINPKKGQGMGSIEVNFNNATVRNDSDLDAIIRAVKQTLNRDAQLQSLGV